MSLEELRRQVADANLAIQDAGLVTLSFGNASGVDREAGLLVIKPSGVPYASLRPDDMVVVSLDDGQVVEGSLRPSIDAPTHRLLYLQFAEIGGVVHTHSPYASAWAQAGRSIPSLGTTHADYFRGEVPVSRPLGPTEIAGDYEWETGLVIAETLRSSGRTATDAPAVLVGSHGPFTWGPTPAAAVEVAIALEAVAAMAIRTLLIEPATPKITSAAYYGQPDDDKA
jgi:L-ribulose-5-phosphate 4-epimerase